MANRRFIDFPVATTVGANDIILIWQDGLNKQTTKATILSGLPEDLEDLADVNISGLTNGQILRYDSTTGKWVNADQANLDLSDLNDVSIVSPSNGQVLVYNSSTSKWENSSAGFVPYVGAVTTVDLGAQGLRAGYVRFDTSVVSVPEEQGIMFWNGDDETINVRLNGYVMHIGEDQFYPVKNQTGSNIPKGTAVRFNGTVGNSGRLLIAPFIANGSVPSTRFMGVTAEAIADGADGKVLYFGRIRGINTNAFNEGDILYASTTVAGGFQTAIPVAPNNIVQVAAVVTKSTNQGTIFVRPTLGSNINKDEGVKITSPATGQLLQLQAGGLWENKTIAQVLGGTSSQFVKGDGSLDSNVYALNSALASYQLLSAKGQPNGYAGLDSNGKVPLAQINDALIGNVNFQGLWNAATNTPTLANPPAAGTKGYYYIVSTAGTFAGISFEVGDWIISSGSAWGKVDNTDAVSSVFGRTGNVTASNGDYNTSQVTESGNLYYTEARVSANTDVAANTAARHAAVTLGTANGLELTGQQLSLGLASAGVTGALSGTDWSTFNSKQNALTNPVTGTGTTNFIPRFTGTTTIGNSTIQTDVSGNLMVGSANAGDAGSINVSVGIAGSTPGGIQLWSSNLGTHYLQFGDGTVGEEKYAGYIGYSHSTNAMVFGTDGGNKMRIYSDGNVSISGFPSNAGFKLDVNGTGRFTGNLTAASFIRSGGTSAQFLKADGSVDSTAYGTGSVTSVAALTLGTSGTDLSSSVANGTTTPVITLNVPTASAANRGALSAADWTTFNNKENAIAAGTTAQYYRGDKTFQTLNTAAVPELTNLYFTTARVLATALTGYVSGANTALAATDTILGAFGKVQGQLNAKQNALNGTGFVKIVGTTISYDNSTYLTTAAAATTYLALTGGTLTGTLNGTTAIFSNDLTAFRGIFTDGNQGLIIGYYTNGNGFGAIYPSTVTPNNQNYSFIAKNDSTVLHAASGGSVSLSINNVASLTIDSSRNAQLAGKFSLRADASGSVTTQVPVFVANPASTTRELVTRTPAQFRSDIGAGNVNGTGTTNYLPKFTGTSTIGDSIIFENGGNVSIGNASPLSIGSYRTLVLQGASTTQGGLIQIQNSDSTCRAYWFNTNDSSTLKTVTNHQLIFGANNTDYLYLNTSGNLGLGVTPSAWDGTLIRAIQITDNGGSISSFSTGNTSSKFTFVSNNAFYDNAGWKYATNGSVAQYRLANDNHQWFTAPSGTAGNAISFTQAMTLFSTGNLLVGSPSPISDNGARLQVIGGNVTFTGGDLLFTSTARAIVFNSAANLNTQIYETGGSLVLRTGGADRLTIASTGAATFSSSVGIGTTPSYRLHVVTDAVAGSQNMSNISRTTANWVRFTNPQYSTDASMGLILRVFPDSDSRQGAGIIASGGNANGVTDLDLFVSSGVASSTSYSALSIKGDTGNVGINTTAPSYPLTVGTAGTTADSYIQIASTTTGTGNLFFGDATGGGLASYSGYIQYQHNIDALIFGTSSTERMRITAGGNVGIGTTTNAGYRLTVENSGADVFLTKNTSASSFNRSFFYNNNNLGAQFLTFGSSYAFGTEFGVGVNGTVLQSNTTSAFAIGTSTSTPLYLGTNGTTRLTIASTGAATFAGSLALPHTTKTANYTLTATDYTVGFDCASSRTANLPDATTCAGRVYVIYQYNTGTGGSTYVTLDGNGSQTINGLTTYSLQYQENFSSVMIQSTGSNWVVISDSVYPSPV